MYINHNKNRPAISKPNKNATISLRIEADYIYRFNTASLEFTSSSFFRISIKSSITIIEVSKGQYDSKSEAYMAEEKEGKFTLKLLALGLFNEIPLQNSERLNEAINSYGMQSFPFISSSLVLEFTSLSLPIKTIILDIPDNFRIIWYRWKAQNHSGDDAIINHSYSPSKASYLFTWKESSIGDYKIDVLLRLGGSSLWQIAHFPILYFYVGLVAISVASFHEQNSVLFAAIIAVWVFLMGHWAKINMPQQNTIATKMYVFFLISSFFWGMMWEIHWLLGALSIPLVLLIVNSFNNAVKFFNQEAILPQFWEQLFYKLNNRRDENNRKMLGFPKDYTFIDFGKSLFSKKIESKKINSPEDE